MKKIVAFILLMATVLPLSAQVSVEARIDSIEMFIGEQVHVTLTVTAGDKANVAFPVFKPQQMVTPGVEVLSSTETGKEPLDNGMASYSRIYTLTSFDGKLYYLPPFAVTVDGKQYKSKSLALKVIEVPVDTANVDKFFGPKGVQDNPFSWGDWSLPFWFSVLMLVLGAFLTICLLCAMLPTKALKTGHRLYRFLTENANTSSQTLMRLTTFLLIFLVTISALFELDAVLGAFAAGFILRYIIPDGSKSLEMKLEGVGYGFLIPVFFVVSGAAINVRAVAGRPALLVAFIVMLMLIRAVPVYVALSLDKRENPRSSHHRVTVALYCTTALPIIVAVTSLAVKVGTMQGDTASTLVAAGAITVFLMPLLGSITYQVADVHPVTAVREIAHTPSDWRTIVHEHAQVRALLHHQDRLKRMAETLDALEKMGTMGHGDAAHSNAGHGDEYRAELVKRARREIDRQLKELGLDPQLTTQLPHNYRYPKN